MTTVPKTTCGVESGTVRRCHSVGRRLTVAEKAYVQIVQKREHRVGYRSYWFLMVLRIVTEARYDARNDGA